MTSQAQIEANRRNAKRSTGPRTAAGRDASSGNALRHGLTAEHVVIFDESAGDFVRFHDEMRAALAPADEVEAELAERVILCAWRLRRATRAETAIFNRKAESVLDRNSRARPQPDICFWRGGGELYEMAALTRYEAAIERAYYRAAAALERRQARRAGECVPAPIVITGEVAVDESRAGEGPAAVVIENCETNPISPPAGAAAVAAAIIAENYETNPISLPERAPGAMEDAAPG